MLHPKNCHQGLRLRTRFFGLEPIDGLILFPPLYVCTALLHQLVLGIALVIVLAAVIRVLKWGALPGYSSALFDFLTLPEHSPTLGHDRAPHYPRGSAP